MTNPTIDTILSRKSTRAFDPSRAISKEDLEIILKCAISAPSGMNIQPWHFTVVQNKELLKELYTKVQEMQKRGPDYNFYKADTLVITTAPADSRFGICDCSCALENMFLCAESLGISSVWINQLTDLSRNPVFKPLLDKLNIPSDSVVCGCAALGYALDSDKKPTSKNPEVVDWFL